MACFLVPAAEAVVTTIAAKVIENKEIKADAEALKNDNQLSLITKEHFSCKLKRLNGLLWGGSALLAFEHLWHGEIQPFFPFLTAVGDSAATAEMLHEMATTGTAMALAVTGIWGVVTFILDRLAKKEISVQKKTAATEVR
ncbi:MAG: hypothetical protein ACI4LO_02840 [Anaerovoracaceae bacterium]